MIPVRFTGSALVALGMAMMSVPVHSQTGHELQVKYVRDSEAYAVLTRQVFRLAYAAAMEQQQALEPGRVWAVVLDLDETVFDNSVYELEVAAYQRPFDAASWDAWVQRREAGKVPGVDTFVEGIRLAGGRIAWISNREASTEVATRANLVGLGLYDPSDRLCLRTDSTYTKAVRRRELMSGSGLCAWADIPVTVVAFLGDQLGDFPTGDEAHPWAGQDGAFGRVFFLLPNPMYGPWSRAVTRIRRRSAE